MTQEEEFVAWENEVWGAGDGDGEYHIMKVLKGFFDTLESPLYSSDKSSYHYRKLEETLGEAVTWLLINDLNRVNAIDYGVSSRNGWLTDQGKRVRDFIKDKTAEELYDILMDDKYNDVCLCNGTMAGHKGWEGHENCKNLMLKD